MATKSSSASWRARRQRWLGFIRGVAKAVERGNGIPIGPSKKPLLAPPVSSRSKRAPKVLICSPHPDDEALVGALPLRLRLEDGARVTNCAITLGSNLSQRARRLTELESSCRVLGFDLVLPNRPSGFDHVNPANRTNQPEEWAHKVEALLEIFEMERPDVVFAPHAEDFNTTHIGTHYLVVDALGAYMERSGLDWFPLIETEFWHQNSQPNLMVGVSPEVLAILVMAAAEHGGEVKRNPYHLRHPAHLMDNVRLGSEVVGGQGGPAYKFLFAELYRVTFMRGREVVAPRPGGHVIGPVERVALAGLVKQFRPEGK
jgi:N-acetylglucosamine malate deacetylase 1